MRRYEASLNNNFVMIHAPNIDLQRVPLVIRLALNANFGILMFVAYTKR